MPADFCTRVLILYPPTFCFEFDYCLMQMGSSSNVAKVPRAAMQENAFSAVLDKGEARRTFATAMMVILECIVTPVIFECISDT